MESGHPVVRELIRRISEGGPISVATFMEICLGDPDGGYYATRDPFGAAGDFTTAPEVSQMFGELLGLWCIDSWHTLGAPEAFALVELGPGRGTLMSDALRAMATVPACLAAAKVHMVETSPVLKTAQQQALAGHDVTWHETLPAPDGVPMICLANEFLDALPVHQFVRTADGWCERRIDYDPRRHELRFVANGPGQPDGDLSAPWLRDAAAGDILEQSPVVETVVGELSRQLDAHGGLALLIDYGHTRHGIGETLQAVRQHRPIDPLAAPGDSDLTAHVDFLTVGETARAAGARTWGPVDQGVFLQRLGIRERADALRGSAGESQARDIETGLARLIGPAEMGTLFKVIAVSDQRIARVAGFD